MNESTPQLDNPAARERLRHYHNQTKHHPHRYARSLGYLDWASQPEPFRRFSDTTMERLPIPTLPQQPSYAKLFATGAMEPAPIDRASLSLLLYGSLALSAWKQAGESRWALRVNPSSGNLHPTEGYLILGPVPSLTDTGGVYHYAPREHALECRSSFDPQTWATLRADWPTDGFLVGLSSIHWREAWKYGERAFRYCQHDVGHALGALRLAAAGLGWRLTVLDHVPHQDVAALLGLDREADFHPHEAEEPDLLAFVSPADPHDTLTLTPRESAVRAVARGRWAGRANPLSPTHVDWPIIDEVTQATRKHKTQIPRVQTANTDRSHDPASPGICETFDPDDGLAKCDELNAWQIIRQRRSAVAFDGCTSIPAQDFYRMLARLMPGPAKPPWDAISWPAHVHLLLFVHLVDGLEPGVYLLLRDAKRGHVFRECIGADLTWTTPEGCPSSLPLYRLAQADCRRVAAMLSLGQEIAGLSAFSLGMLAEMGRGLNAYGPWFYRALFWEAGLIGQVLYLEAEAHGVRGTGIGAYFDDQVHDLLELRNDRIQSLYHFTVGGPVDDPRIDTCPAYP